MKEEENRERALNSVNFRNCSTCESNGFIIYAIQYIKLSKYSKIIILRQHITVKLYFKIIYFRQLCYGKFNSVNILQKLEIVKKI